MLYKDQNFVIPAGTEYFLDDVSHILTKLKGRTFDLILMDPPWENKHVKRTMKRQKIEQGVKTLAGKSTCYGYEMLSNETIGEIPIDKLLSKPDGLLIIFCTNSKRHQDAIKEWLSRWGLVKIAKWHWLKV